MVSSGFAAGPSSLTAAAALRDQLIDAPPRSIADLVLVSRPGVYAWWGEISWPPSFPAVPPGLPIYVGKADTEPLGQRARSFHLRRTRGSALRRSLAAVLVDELELQPHVVRDRRSWALNAVGEAKLTAWMHDQLRVTWVELDDPGEVEQAIILQLLPPLNDKHATGSPYRAPMRELREALRAAGETKA